LVIHLSLHRHRNLIVVISSSLLIHVIYRLLFPYEINIDVITHVKTLWDPGWFDTVAFKYSQLCVQNGVLPYTATLVGYPFSVLEYPFLAGLLFYAIYLVSGDNFTTYTTIFQIVNMIFQAGISGSIYLIASRFCSSRRSVILGVGYALAPFILWTSMSRYDSIPTFFALLSLQNFLSKKRRLSYVWLALGMLFKIYPGLLVLAYLKYGLRNKFPKRYFLELIGIPSAVILLGLSPLLILNPFVVPALLGLYATFGWNWESIYGPIDQFLRPVFPSLAFIFIHQEIMRIVFILACLSVLLLDLKSEWQLINGVGYAVLCWMQTQWFFSPQYTLWISPILLSVATSNLIVLLYALIQGIMTLEIPSPFYFLAPVPQFYYGLYVFSTRILIFFVVMAILILRIQRESLKRTIDKMRRWWRQEEL